MSEDKEYKTWVCPKCGHIVLSKTQPQPIRWADGHVCIFTEEKK